MPLGYLFGMHKTFSIVAAIALGLSLSACGGGSVDDAADTGVETNTYRGETLTCIEAGLLKSKVRTCDFEGFYNTHPSLLDQSAEDFDNDGVWWTTYRDEPMPCYREGRADYRTLSCDFAWFSHAHPNLLG